MRRLLIVLVPLLWGTGLLLAQHEPAAKVSGLADEELDSKLRSPEIIEAGKDQFLTVCSGCHGPNGQGGRGPKLTPGPWTARLSNKELFGVVEKGLPGTDMPPSPLPEEKIWQVVAFVQSLSAPAYESIVPGDPQAGEALFFGKAECSGCHMIRGRGGFLGPDLTNIGMSRSLPMLQEGLREPNARITEGFSGVKVVTKEGQTISGVARNNSNYSIQVLDRNGGLHLLPKRDLADVIFQRDSWMPADYQKRLRAEELRDLTAFLSRQAVRGPVKKAKKPKEN